MRYLIIFWNHPVTILTTYATVAFIATLSSEPILVFLIIVASLESLNRLLDE